MRLKPFIFSLKTDTSEKRSHHQSAQTRTIKGLVKKPINPIIGYYYQIQ